MGRFKRHQRKNRGTATMVAYPPIPKGAYPKNYNVGKEPEISDKVKEMLVSSPSSDSTIKHKGVHVSSLVGSMLRSVKRRRMYPSLLSQYHLPYNMLINDDELVNEVINRHWLYINHDEFQIGDIFKYSGPIPYHSYNKKTVLYHSLLGRIILLNELLQRSKKYMIAPLHLPYIHYVTILNYFTHDEVEKLNNEGKIALYPNELVFTMMFGVIFASIGFLFFIYCLAILFNIYAALLFSSIIMIMFSLEYGS